MPRYCFDIKDAGQIMRDDHGVDLTDDGKARGEAIALLPEIAREALPDGDQHEFAATVRNGAGAVVYEASLALSGRWWPGRR